MFAATGSLLAFGFTYDRLVFFLKSSEGFPIMRDFQPGKDVITNVKIKCSSPLLMTEWTRSLYCDNWP